MINLIINADDFGMSNIFNQEILDLIEKDLITSTTVMVNRGIENQKDQVKELINVAKAHDISVGLHLELEDSEFEPQIEEQFEKFKKVFGINPSHIDLHKAAIFKDSNKDSYRNRALGPIEDFCKGKNLPCRNKGTKPKGIRTTDEIVLSGTHKDFSEIEEWIKGLEEGKSYEILFHPGKYDPDCKSSLNKDREKDVDNIIKLNAILKENNIEKISFSNL